jgi:hypothetical protein
LLKAFLLNERSVIQVFEHKAAFAQLSIAHFALETRWHRGAYYRMIREAQAPLNRRLDFLPR